MHDYQTNYYIMYSRMYSKAIHFIGVNLYIIILLSLIARFRSVSNKCITNYNGKIHLLSGTKSMFQLCVLGYKRFPVKLPLLLVMIKEATCPHHSPPLSSQNSYTIARRYTGYTEMYRSWTEYNTSSCYGLLSKIKIRLIYFGKGWK